VDSNISPERAYSVGDRGPRHELSWPDRSGRAAALTRGMSLIVILVLSLGLWAAIWAVVASLPSFGLR
jgi:hypothetical protein